MLRKMFYIQLYDYNCGSCTSGVTYVYTDDIEGFAAKYQQSEKDKERVERFLQSKSGKIVTDYYSNLPELNSVNETEIEEIGHKHFAKDRITITTYNGYNWESFYYFGKLSLDVMWIKVDSEFYKLAKPSGRDCCMLSERDALDAMSTIFVYGNPFWINYIGKDTDERSMNVEDYRGTSIESYVWQVVDKFETEEDLQKDMKLDWLTDKQIASAFRDLPGEAG